MSRLRCSFLLAAALTSACQSATYEYRDTKPGPRGVVVTPVRDYPFGDAVDVYRAALDLLYSDGEDRPKVIVMHDSASLRFVGPSPHQAKMDTSVIEAFATMPRVQPRIRPFGYSVPIVFLSNREFGDMMTLGAKHDSVHRRPGVQPIEGPMIGEFRRRYPEAWGWVSFTPVAFNTARTEALLGVTQRCGDSCYSLEALYLRKVGGTWRPVERVAREAEASGRSRLRFRGPAVDKVRKSELLVDQLGSPLRTDSRDAPDVYRAVLDSLYSFHGERPRMIVIGDQHAYTQGGLLPYKHRIDSSTRAAFAFQSAIADRMNPSFKYHIPTAVLTYELQQALEQQGIPLQRKAELNFANEETAGFWLAFREWYPNAWGYVEFSRIGFNPEHTQALVYTRHVCGASCENGDTWLLLRDGERWSVAEKLPRAETEAAGWALDSLRYLGRGADPSWYRPRRARGVVTNAETGAVLPFLDVSFGAGAARITVRTDSTGHYVAENLPLNGELFFRVRCPVPGRADTVAGPYLRTRPGLDTTVNVEIPFRACLHLNRNHPLIAAGKVQPVADSTALPPDVAGVYRGVLDELYPRSTSRNQRIMLEAMASLRCDACIEPEMPRLVRKGLIDPSTEINFSKLSTSSAPPPLFSYDRKVELMRVEDQYWIRTNGYDWSAMKDAFPGVGAVRSFSGVGFNDRGTEALVQVHAESASPIDDETMLVKKTGTDWRVALRHVEREATSGEWAGGKCEPTDAPSQLPSPAAIEKLVGEFRIDRVGASKAFRGQSDAVRVRLEPLQASARRAKELGSKATVIDAAGRPQLNVAATFELTADTVRIVFGQAVPDGAVVLDGWHEEYKILRIDGRGFFGAWYTVSGPTVPLKGYFCAKR